MYLDQPERLERQLGLTVSRPILTDRVRKAITMKLAKMENADEAAQLWFTYWLIVIRTAAFGAGMAGFKGLPDENHEVEIGYGIDPGFQNQGYMTEAVESMIRWALEGGTCRSVVAIGVDKSNPASRRVLAKAGMTPCEEAKDTLSCRIRREDLIPPR